MSKTGPLPPERKWDIPEHCEGAPSELLLQALNRPFVALIVCRGCGKKHAASREDSPILTAEEAIREWGDMNNGYEGLQRHLRQAADGGQGDHT